MKAPIIQPNRNSEPNIRNYKPDIFKKYNSSNYRNTKCVHSTTSYWRRDKPVFAMKEKEKQEIPFA